MLLDPETDNFNSESSAIARVAFSSAFLRNLMYSSVFLVFLKALARFSYCFGLSSRFLLSASLYKQIASSYYLVSNISSASDIKDDTFSSGTEAACVMGGA